MEELDKITKDCKRVRDSIKRPKRGSVKSVIYAQLGEDEDGHATGKVEIKSDSIDRYRF